MKTIIEPAAKPKTKPKISLLYFKDKDWITSFKTLKVYEAEKNRTFERAALIKRFQEEQKDFITVLEKWKEKDLAVYVMPHPALGKLTIREFVYFTILHTYHHLENLKTNYIK